MKSIQPVLLLIFIAVVTAGCAGVPINATYDRSEIAWSLGEGTGQVEGNAFLTRGDGQVVRCSGEMVSLGPVSSYTEEYNVKVYGSPKGGFAPVGLFGAKGADIKDEVERQIAQDHRFTRCDVDGRFSFSNLPPGEYFVETGISWTPPDPDLLIPTGGMISRRITVRENQTTEVTLTR